MSDYPENLEGGGKKRGLGVIRTQTFSIKEKYMYLMQHSIQSQHQHLYCFLQGCWIPGPFGLYFCSLLAILQCNKRQGSCLLQASNIYTPYSGEFYGDVLHEGITKKCFFLISLKLRENVSNISALCQAYREHF